MQHEKQKLAIAAGVLLPLFVASYFLFTTYQPKALKTLQEVRGISTINNTYEFPYPTDAQKIGFTQTPYSKQATFQTSKTLEEIRMFYKNIYEAKDWKVSSENMLDHTLTITYTDTDQKVNIVATSQEDKTSVVSIESITLKN